MARHSIELPPKLVEVFTGPARYRGSYGGRGSGKTRSFAKMAAVVGLKAALKGKNGIILCCREYMNSLDESSMAEVKAAILSDPWLSDGWEIGEKFIRTKDGIAGRVDFKFAGLRHNLDSIKSKASIILCWVDEAEPVADEAWVKLVPTVREHESEIWVTWNPETKRSATHKRFRENASDDMKIVELNWKDNPWFPDVLDDERKRDRLARPEQYEHIWNGDFATVIEGAYYAEHLALAQRQGRVGKVSADPLLPIRFYHDLAFSNSDKADAYAMWVTQFVNQEIRLLGYYESVGQSLDYHVRWVRDWMEREGRQKVLHFLPHDGKRPDGLGNQYGEHWAAAATQDYDWTVSVIPNQGKGAAMQRIEAGRRNFSRMWFDEAGTESGREALAHYHEKRDLDREIGLGPNHDWASHGADAFGMCVIDYEDRGVPQQEIEQMFIEYGTMA